jgi:hypothetical protein
MKKIIYTVVFLLLGVSLMANNEESLPYPEADFIGEVYVIENDSVFLLEKQRTRIHAQASATMYIFGIGDIKSSLKVANRCSSTRVKEGKKIKLLVRAQNNDMDPMTVLSLFRFEQKKKQRAAVITKAGTFSGVSAGLEGHILFTAKRYGKSSYILEVSEMEDGEYGIMINGTVGPDGLINVSTLGVGDCDANSKAAKNKKKK